MFSEEQILRAFQDQLEENQRFLETLSKFRQQYEAEGYDKISDQLSNIENKLDCFSASLGDFIVEQYGHLLPEYNGTSDCC